MTTKTYTLRTNARRAANRELARDENATGFEILPVEGGFQFELTYPAPTPAAEAPEGETLLQTARRLAPGSRTKKFRGVFSNERGHAWSEAVIILADGTEITGMFDHKFGKNVYFEMPSGQRRMVSVYPEKGAAYSVGIVEGTYIVDWAQEFEAGQEAAA